MRLADPGAGLVEARRADDEGDHAGCPTPRRVRRAPRPPRPPGARAAGRATAGAGTLTPAADHHVVDPAEHVQPAVVVEPAGVGGQEPAVDQHLGGAAPGRRRTRRRASARRSGSGRRGRSRARRRRARSRRRRSRRRSRPSRTSRPRARRRRRPRAPQRRVDRAAAEQHGVEAAQRVGVGVEQPVQLGRHQRDERGRVAERGGRLGERRGARRAAPARGRRPASGRRPARPRRTTPAARAASGPIAPSRRALAAPTPAPRPGRARPASARRSSRRSRRPTARGRRRRASASSARGPAEFTRPTLVRCVMGCPGAIPSRPVPAADAAGAPAVGAVGAVRGRRGRVHHRQRGVLHPDRRAQRRPGRPRPDHRRRRVVLPSPCRSASSPTGSARSGCGRSRAAQAALLYAVWPFIGGFATFLAMMVAARAWSTPPAGPAAARTRSTCSPARSGSGRMAFMRAALNIGFTLGALLGGLALAFDSDARDPRGAAG